MNPGEYIGKDGRTYRWKHERLSDNSAEGYDHQAHVHEWETEWIDPADWDDAKAALDALVLSEKVELEKQEAQASEVLRDACLEFRKAASRRGQVCGPCDECKLQPYWGKGVDALVESESVEWVEIDDNARIQADGSDPQVRHERSICCWRGLTIDKRWPKAYRKGREVAEAEAAELRDAVRELVEAVLRAVDNARVDPQTQRDIRNAAKYVEAKL